MRTILILLIFLMSILDAKIPRIFVSIKQKDIKAGDKVEIMIGAEAKKGSKFKFPKIDEIGGYKVLSRKALVTYRVDEKNGKKIPLVKRAVVYTIKPTKKFDIASYTIKVNNKELKSVPFSVKVLSKEQKKQKVDKKEQKKDIKKESNKNNQKEQQIIKNPTLKEQKKEINKPNTLTTNKEQNNTLVQNNDFIFKMSSNKKSVVVGESFIVKVSLIEPINLSSSDLKYIPPKFEGFDAQPIGNGKIEESSNSVIRTIEYLVVAKKSGNLKITPASAKVGIQLTPQVQSPFGFFGADIEWKKLTTNSLAIKVYPKPKNVDLIGKFKLETFTDTKKAKANRPFNYTIRVIGLGNLDNFNLPDIKMDNIIVYKEKPKIEHILTKGIVVSKLTQKYVFISDRDFVIPSTVINVYNPESKKVYKLKTKPLIVKLKKENKITSILNSNSNPFHKKDINHNINSVKTTAKALDNKNKKSVNSKEMKKVEELLLDKYYYQKKFSKGYPLSTIFGAFILGLILGAGALVLIPGVLRVTKDGKLSAKNRLFSNYEEALNILYPHTTKSKSIEKMVANLYEVTNGNKEVKIDDYALNRMIKKVKGDN